mgnify:CR=1 FL=1
MGLYTKLKLLMRATAEKPARQLVNQNDIIIFEQELSEAEQSIKFAKLHLAKVKTEKRSLKDSLNGLNENILIREEQTLEAMKINENLASELATLLAEDEIALREQKKQFQQIEILEIKLTADLKKAVREIQSHHRHVKLLKASQHGIHSDRLTEHNSQGLNSTLRELNESLNNIKQRQLISSYLDDAENEVENSLSSKSIDEQLQLAGIKTGKHDATAVLERLRLQQTTLAQETLNIDT